MDFQIIDKTPERWVDKESKISRGRFNTLLIGPPGLAKTELALVMTPLAIMHKRKARMVIRVLLGIMISLAIEKIILM